MKNFATSFLFGFGVGLAFLGIEKLSGVGWAQFIVGIGLVLVAAFFYFKGEI